MKFALFGALALGGCALFTSLDDLRSSSVASDAATDAPAPASGIYVDASKGSDANAGTSDAPFKTFKRALSSAKNGDAIFIRPGTYDAANGEDFGAFVPDGASVHGTAPGVKLVGTPAQTAFSFAGSATVDSIATSGFFTAFKSTSGTQTITNVGFDGASVGADVSGNAHLQLQNATSSTCAIVGRVAGAATLTIKGAQLFGAGAGSVAVLDATDASELSLDTVTANGASATNVVRAGGTSKLSMTACTFESSASTGVRIEAGASATIVGGAMQSLAMGIVTYAKTTITNVEVSGSTGTGLDVLDGAVVTMSSSTITHNQNGGFYVQNGHLTVRGTKITDNTGDGVWVFGNSIVDLGISASDPGNDTLTGNTGSGLDVAQSTNVEFLAKGDTWVPNVQGVDAQGQVPSGAIISGTAGPNFAVSTTQMLYAGF